MRLPGNQNDAEQERLQEGCHQLAREKSNGLRFNIKAKAFELKIPYATLYSRFRNIHKPRSEAHAHQQLLSDSITRYFVTVFSRIMCDIIHWILYIHLFIVILHECSETEW